MEGQSQCLSFTVLPALPKLEVSLRMRNPCLVTHQTSARPLCSSEVTQAHLEFDRSKKHGASGIVPFRIRAVYPLCGLHDTCCQTETSGLPAGMPGSCCAGMRGALLKPSGGSQGPMGCSGTRGGLPGLLPGGRAQEVHPGPVEHWRQLLGTRAVAGTLSLMAAQARVEGLPDCFLEGELRRCTLVLRNSGASALRGIRAVTSGPGVHLAPGNAELDSPSVDAVLTGELLHALILKHISFQAHRTVGHSVALPGITGMSALQEPMHA